MKKLFFSAFVLLAGNAAMAQPYSMSGHIQAGSSASPVAQVFLISVCTDSVNNTHILTAIDSTITDTNGMYYFTNVNQPSTSNCWLTVKAALVPGTVNYSSYLPTYYDSAISWSSAHAITFYAPAITYNILMRGGTNPGGPGFIGGDVQQGANKGTAVGDPLANRILLLTDAANKPIAYTHSNAAGKFSFGSVPYGSYKLFGDAGGKLNPMMTVTVSAAAPSVNNIIFQENDESFEGHFSTTSASQVLLANAMPSIYPNPVTNVVYVKGIEAIPGAKTLTIRSMNGATVATQQFAAGEQLSANVAALATGVYTVHIATEAGNTVLKMVK